MKSWHALLSRLSFIRSTLHVKYCFLSLSPGLLLLFNPFLSSPSPTCTIAHIRLVCRLSLLASSFFFPHSFSHCPFTYFPSSFTWFSIRRARSLFIGWFCLITLFLASTLPELLSICFFHHQRTPGLDLHLHQHQTVVFVVESLGLLFLFFYFNS